MESDYRLLKHIYRDPTNGVEQTYLQIHEVFYDNGKPKSVVVKPVVPFGMTGDEIVHALNRMADACAKPVLDIRDFDGPPRRIDQDKA